MALPAVAIHPALPSGTDREIVHAYHERTKHRLERFAPAPETLDWDAQPAPFRRFVGASTIPLALLEELGSDHPCTLAAERAFGSESSPVREWNRETLGVALQFALGITAHKSVGPERWAVRANPSSGNLHPVEAYVIAHELEWLSDGVHHYAPDAHELEHVADLASRAPGLYIALTTVPWREAWKYGERGFRYCQLDAGHAMASLRYALAMLGAASRECAFQAADLARLLWPATDMDSCAPTEREEVEALIRVDHPALPRASTWLDSSQVASRAVDRPIRRSRIDAHPMYRWPIVEIVARATRSVGMAARLRAESDAAPASTGLTARRTAPTRTISTDAPIPSFRQVILGRRSAQRFDIRYRLSSAIFHRLVETLRLELARQSAARRTMPSAHPTELECILIVHRVADVEPGVYTLARPTIELSEGRWVHDAIRSTATPELGIARQLAWEPRGLMRTSRRLHCNQDIASSCCFAVGILGSIDAAIDLDPSGYRRLHREAGMLGHALYLGAEAERLRATGIGCFFDDEIRKSFHIPDSPLQPIYHLAVGQPLADSRIQTTVAYPTRRRCGADAKE